MQNTKQQIKNFLKNSLWKWARDLDLDLGSGHTAYRHASLIDLYLHKKFIKIEETLCGQMDGVWTDIWNPLY